MILGYEILPVDNQQFFIKNENKLPKEYAFKNTYAYDDLSITLMINDRQLDISATCDCFAIVSSRFKRLCIESNFENLEFIPLPKDKEFFELKVHSIVQFDSVRRGTKFEKFDMNYNAFEWVHGSSPVYLTNNFHVPEGTIFRSDIFFGAGVRKNPVLMIGIETYKTLLKWKLRGIYFEEILDNY